MAFSTETINKPKDSPKTTSKWWENTPVQVLVVIGAIAGILSPLITFIPSIANWWPWFAIGACILFVIAAFKIYIKRSNKSLVFIPDEMKSLWHHAPQPDGRKLTQISLSGYVTNTSNKSLHLADIRLVSPRARRTHQKFIYTVHHNAVDSSDRPIMPSERTEFSGHFFAEGFMGIPNKPMTIVVVITDNLGRRYRVKFPSLWRPEDR